jgi:hypothetical protein
MKVRKLSCGRLRSFFVTTIPKIAKIASFPFQAHLGNSAVLRALFFRCHDICHADFVMNGTGVSSESPP